MIQLKKFTNLIELLTHFNDEQVCRDYLEQIPCPYDNYGKIYKCSCCDKQFSVRVGTIFEDRKKVEVQKLRQ